MIFGIFGIFGEVCESINFGERFVRLQRMQLDRMRYQRYHTTQRTPSDAQHVQNIAALPFLQGDPLPLLTLDPITNRLAFHEEPCQEFKIIMTQSMDIQISIFKSLESGPSLCQKQIAQRMQTASIDAQENLAQLQSAEII